MKHVLQDKIIDIISRCRDLTIATVRPDGAPQATIVSFVHDGLMIYFGCGEDSQKATNIAAEPRVSIAMSPAYESWVSIEGVSMGGIAEEVTVPGEIANVTKMMNQRFPQIKGIEVPEGSAIKLFQVRPTIVSVLDYSKGFGHTELVSVDAEDIAESLQSMQHHWLVPSDDG